MDQKDRELLQKVLEVTEENNRMVHRIYRSWWWGRIARAFYWLVIIGIAFGTFYFLQPYVDKVKEVLGTASASVDTVQKFGQAVIGN